MRPAHTDGRWLTQVDSSRFASQNCQLTLDSHFTLKMGIVKIFETPNIQHVNNVGKKSAFLSPVTSANTATAANILRRNGTQKHQRQWNKRSDWNAPVIMPLYFSRSRSIECWTCVKFGNLCIVFYYVQYVILPTNPLRCSIYKKKTSF